MLAHLFPSNKGEKRGEGDEGGLLKFLVFFALRLFTGHY